MAYKYAKGKVYRGDIYDEDDTQRDTYIDFGGDSTDNYIGLVASGSTVLVVTGSSVGIGTAAPGCALDIQTEPSNNGDQLRMGNSSNYYKIGRGSGGFLEFRGTQAGYTGYTFKNDDGSTDLTILDSGYVGIGTAAPDTTLHVEGTNGGSTWEAVRITNRGATTGDDSAIYFTHYTDDRLQAFIKDDIGSGWDTKLHFGTSDGANNAATKMTLDGDGKLGVGTETPDHELTIAGNVSASSNVSASAFYGDGSNLDGVGSNIHAPWISGSDLTYEMTYSGSAEITLSGYNFASGIVASLESQFTTDGHSTGSTTWNNPTSVSFSLTASAQTASYDIILTNTDGLTYTLTDGIFITSCAAAAALQTIELTSNDDIAESDVLGFAADGGVAGDVEGLRITGVVPDLWGTQCHSVAEIACADRAYIECTPTVMSTSPTDAYHWMMGFGYSGSYAAGPTYDFEWMRWDVYCWGGGAIAAQSPGGTTLVDGSGHPNAYNDTTLAQMASGRSLRLEIIDSTVYLKYSDDSWSTETTFWTFPEKVDIAGNSNLVAGFAIHKGSGNDGVIENIKMYGRLEGIDNGDNGH